MKKTFMIKTFLLMFSLVFLYTIPAFASTGTISAAESDYLSADAEAGSRDALTENPSEENGLAPMTGTETIEAPAAEAPAADGPAAEAQNSEENTSAALEGGSSVSESHATPLGSFRLTAYCPCRSCSGKWGRRTSTGATATAGHTVAVDPKVIPMGSKLLINGTVYTAQDVGGGVKGRHVDIFFNSHQETRHFGSQRAEIYLIP